MSTFEEIDTSSPNDKQNKEDKINDTRKCSAFGIFLAVPVIIVFGAMLGVIIMLVLMKIPECDCVVHAKQESFRKNSKVIMTTPVAMTTPIAMTTPASSARNCPIATCSAENTTETSSVRNTNSSNPLKSEPNTNQSSVRQNNSTNTIIKVPAKDLIAVPTTHSFVTLTTVLTTNPSPVPGRQSTDAQTTNPSLVPTTNSAVAQTTNQSSVPTTTSTAAHTTIPLTTSQATTSSTAVHTTVPLTTSQATTSSTAVHTIVPLTTSQTTTSSTAVHTTVPLTTSQATTSSTAVHTIVPLTTSQATISSTAVHTTVPLTTSQATCSSYSGYTYDKSTGVCYKILLRGFRYRSYAVYACEHNSGGRLLRVDSFKIQNFAVRIMGSKLVKASWIEGMRDSLEWLDTDGKPLSYLNWSSKYHATRCCFLVMLASGEMIVRRVGTVGISVICEIRPRSSS